MFVYLSQPLFAFQYKEEFPVDGWKVYDPVTEYKRMVRQKLHIVYISILNFTAISSCYLSFFLFYLIFCRVCQMRAGQSVRSTVIMKCVTLILLYLLLLKALKMMRSNEWHLSEPNTAFRSASLYILPNYCLIISAF